MNFYPEGYEFYIAADLRNGVGEYALPNSISAVINDDEGALIADLGSIVVPDSGEFVNVTIPGSSNILSSGELRAARVLLVTLVYNEGEVKTNYSYGVEKDIRLEIMVNSFMPYVTAEVISMDFVNTTAWDIASEAQRKTALVEAFNRLIQIPMKWNPRDEEGKPIRLEENIIERDLWLEIDSDAFSQWPTHFKRALRRAQFIEANELLQGDVFSRKRRQGILEETIGESHVKISAGMVDYGVSSETLAALAGYIYFNMRIGRS